MRSFIAVGLALVLFSCASVPSGADARDCGSGELQLGDAMPAACEFATFEGDVVRLGVTLGGKPSVVNFWASWCRYCIEEMPAFQTVFEQAAGEVAFLGVDLLGVQAESEHAAIALAERTAVSYPLVFDEGGRFYDRICGCGGRPLMPSTALVRADGTLAYRSFGPLSAEELRALILEHLDVEVSL